MNFFPKKNPASDRYPWRYPSSNVITTTDIIIIIIIIITFDKKVTNV